MPKCSHCGQEKQRVVYFSDDLDKVFLQIIKDYESGKKAENSEFKSSEILTWACRLAYNQGLKNF